MQMFVVFMFYGYNRADKVKKSNVEAIKSIYRCLCV